MIESSFLPNLAHQGENCWTGRIINIGCFITGDLENPTIDADCLFFENGKISFVGRERDAPEADHDLIVDALGTTVFPGLIDSHVHPTMGEFTPRTDTSSWIPQGQGVNFDVSQL